SSPQAHGVLGWRCPGRDHEGPHAFMLFAICVWLTLRSSGQAAVLDEQERVERDGQERVAKVLLILLAAAAASCCCALPLHRSPSSSTTPRRCIIRKT